MWNKRVKAHLILIFSTNTNCESMAYRSFSPSGFEARGVRKVTTGINYQLVPVGQPLSWCGSSLGRLVSVLAVVTGILRRHTWMLGHPARPAIPSVPRQHLGVKATRDSRVITRWIGTISRRQGSSHVGGCASRRPVRYAGPFPDL